MKISGGEDHFFYLVMGEQAGDPDAHGVLIVDSRIIEVGLGKSEKGVKTVDAAENAVAVVLKRKAVGR